LPSGLAEAATPPVQPLLLTRGVGEVLAVMDRPINRLRLRLQAMNRLHRGILVGLALSTVIWPTIIALNLLVDL
jgi:hypothetical protein